MDVTIIEEGKNKIEFEVGGVSHGFCNILKDELNKDSHIKIASYRVKHPLVSKPRFVVETDGADAKKTIISAAQKVKKEFEKFEDESKKELK